MEDNIEYETLGYYEPGFMHLRVNTDYDIRDLNKIFKDEKYKKEASTFLHEYIHFLQDITTTTGLTLGDFYVDFIKDFNWKIRRDKNNGFNVPVSIDNEFNSQTKIKLREIYKGESKEVSYVKYERYEKVSTEIKDKDNNIIKPERYKVHYLDTQRREQNSFYFGYACLKEQIAHSIQNKYLENNGHPDIPYQIAEQIIKTEYPDFGSNYKFIVALCDSSLMSFHPAQMFFNTIEKMKEKAFKPKNCAEIYEFAFKDLTFNGEMGNFTVETLFNRTSNNTYTQYFDALNTPIFQDILEWLKFVLEEAQKIRINNPDFITKLLDEDGNLSSVFYDVFSKLGTPFFTNNKHIGGYVPPRNLSNVNDRPFQTLVFKEVLSVYFGKKECSMIDFCKLSPEKEMVNTNCRTAPWEKVNEKDLCPFAQLWKTWGLKDKKPVHK
jgi:hypothetical protein